MKTDKIAISIASVGAAAWTPAHGYESGAAGWAQKPGITLGGSSAEAPPPGLYMVDQVFTYQTNLTGPGNNVLNPQALDEVSASAPGGHAAALPGTNHHQGRQRLCATLVPPLGSRRARIAAEVLSERSDG
jgi:hypothetical protein